jgi:hypothetical protein
MVYTNVRNAIYIPEFLKRRPAWNWAGVLLLVRKPIWMDGAAVSSARWHCVPATAYAPDRQGAILVGKNQERDTRFAHKTNICGEVWVLPQ